MTNVFRVFLVGVVSAAVFLVASASNSDGGHQYSEPVAVQTVHPAEESEVSVEALRQITTLPATGKVMVIVNTSIYSSISDSLSMYKKDLEREGYTVEVYTWTGGTKETFRDSLKAHRTDLVGIVLIGTLPIPWTEFMNNHCWAEPHGYWTDSIPNDLYYCDLDGDWADKDNDGPLDWVDPRMAIDPDIWIGRLNAANLDSLNEITALKGYFSRNHQYRLGNVVRKSSSLQFVNVFGDLCPRMDDSPLTEVFDELVYVCPQSPGGSSKAVYLDSLGADFENLRIVSHGTYGLHHFRYPNTVSVMFYDIQHANSRPLFIHSYSCGSAAWHHQNCLSSYYIFGRASGLVATGVTITWGWNGPYDCMSGRKTFGEGMKGTYAAITAGHSCQPLIDSLENTIEACCYYKTDTYLALVGDPTLRPRKWWKVNAAGTGDAPTIQAAINSAYYYDRILLASGTYTGAGNYDIDFQGKPVVVTKEYDSSTVVIDCQNTGRAFWFHSAETPGTKIVGLRIRNGNVSGDGGAILCQNGASPEIIDCLIENCRATGNGGAAAIFDSCKTLLKGCTIVFGSGAIGGGVYISFPARPYVTNCLVTYSRGGGGVYHSGACGTGSGLVWNSDVFGNTGGNYTGSLTCCQGGGNFSLDPMYCDTTGGDFTVDLASPCVPINMNGGLYWIGSERTGCTSVVCGDANGDGYVDISDIVFLNNYIFSGGLAPDPKSTADVDCSDCIDISDVVYIISYIFSGGPAPCAACQ